MPHPPLGCSAVVSWHQEGHLVKNLPSPGSVRFRKSSVTAREWWKSTLFHAITYIGMWSLTRTLSTSGTSLSCRSSKISHLCRSALFLTRSAQRGPLLLYTVSNHFYYHITACVPWWVKLLRAFRNYSHIDSTYLQTYTEDNVQNKHTYTQYTQSTIRQTYSYQYTLYTVCTHSTLCTHIYTHNMQRCNRLYKLDMNVMDVYWMVSSDSR